MGRDSFATYHPVVGFTFFCAVIVFGVIFLHPLLLAVSLAGALAYAVYLKGRKAVGIFFKGLLPMTAVVTVINTLFNHYGTTILGYFRGNPITGEAVIYGIVTGLMFSAVILWCVCYSEVMTSDKFLYLFGRVIPAASLIFSMVLRFIPKYRAQMKRVSAAQRCVGRDAGSGSLKEKVYHGMKMLSIMTTWALENAIDTSDSMRSRGYGLKGRTAYSNYRFDRRDGIVFAVLVCCVGGVIAGGVFGLCTLTYYPMMEFAGMSPAFDAVFAAYCLLCFGPVIIDVKEDIKWKRLKSKI